LSRKKGSSEVDAYAFIERELKVLGWDTRNPSKVPQGQVFTQNECLSDPEIKKWLDKKRPEAIVKVNETTLWVIEAKRERTKLDEALDEAENYYAARLNKSKIYKTAFITGLAGNDLDGYVVKNRYLESSHFEPVLLNDREMTGLLTPEITKRILGDNSASLHDVPIDLASFMKKADKINETLHEGAINIHDRARVMAALLLATMGDDQLSLKGEPSVLIKDINTRAEAVLEREGKKEFFDYVKLSLPTSKDNHQKYKRALVDTFKELYSLNIKSAMNSGNDVLGQFYEVFLKYGNWAEKMGIVLTPRHVTKFATEAVDVGLNDFVLDPVCGTGGFLVSSFDHIKKSATKPQIDKFKRFNLFGIDQQAQLVTLAIVNMIFRGDGKNNIVEGDCFSKWLESTMKSKSTTATYVDKKPKDEELAITKVLMNPPFAIKTSDVKEYRFVQHALDQIAPGGILFSVLPVGAMLEGGEEKEWRENRLLQENTVLSVVTFPPDLFYPVGVHTLGIFIRKGTPHPKKQNVLWARAIHDSFVKVKGRRLPSADEPDDLTRALPLVKAFLQNPTFPVASIPEFCKVAPIDFKDPQLELVPEAYLDSKPISNDEIDKEMDHMVRETIAYLIKAGKEALVKDDKD
jgi:type I restriction-modification system DNA methylase subunit